MFTQTELMESLCFEERNPQHVIPTVIQHLITSTKEIIKLNELQDEWKSKHSSWSEWTVGLAKQGAYKMNNKLHTLPLYIKSRGFLGIVIISKQCLLGQTPPLL